VQNIPKSLIVISDMLEFTPDYNQYPPADLSYARFRRSPAYPKFQTDLPALPNPPANSGTPLNIIC
jgi:hypothetical protein